MHVVDLFCGAGGLSEGFSNAGFTVVAGQDINFSAGKTFSVSHPQAALIGGAIQNVSADDILKAADINPENIDVVIGGPPCQGYSYYNHKRGCSDPRAGLFREYLRIVKGLRPRWIVMENVAGIAGIGGGSVLREIMQKTASLGYRTEYKLLKAEDYGVPQERRRMFFIGTLTDRKIQFPEPSYGSGFPNPYTTIGDAINDLPVPVNGRGAGMPYTLPAITPYQKLMRNECTVLSCHEAPKLSELNMKRLEHIPPGGSWRDIPVELLPAGMQRARRSDHTTRYGRPLESELSCTVLTKCDVHWGAFFHPRQKRSFTAREAARLQSFPDRFTFYGSKTEQFVQIGNAVPPLLGTAVAMALKNTHQN